MIVHKKRRSFRQCLIDWLHVQTSVDKAERDRWFESGIRVGIAIVTEKPVHGDFHHYGQMIAEQASGAMQAIKLARAIDTGEKPASQQTADVGIKPPLMGARQVHAAHMPTQRNLSEQAPHWNADSLKRMIDTTHVPAIAKGTTGVLLGMHLARQKKDSPPAPEERTIDGWPPLFPDDAHKSG